MTQHHVLPVFHSNLLLMSPTDAVISLCTPDPSFIWLLALCQIFVTPITSDDTATVLNVDMVRQLAKPEPNLDAQTVL